MALLFPAFPSVLLFIFHQTDSGPYVCVQVIKIREKSVYYVNLLIKILFCKCILFLDPFSRFICCSLVLDFDTVGGGTYFTTVSVMGLIGGGFPLVLLRFRALSLPFFEQKQNFPSHLKIFCLENVQKKNLFQRLTVRYAFLSI